MNLKEEIELALKEEDIQLITANEDGRVNSSLDEPNIINTLQIYFGDRLTFAPPRKWWDLLIDDTPCNVKTTNGGTDNVGNYLMLRHCFGEEDENLLDKSANKTRDMGALLPLFEKYKNDTLEDSGKSYYFIVVFKDTKEVLVRNLRCITEVKQNPSNLPFQINWNQERQNEENTSRTIKKCWKDFIIDPLQAVERSFEVKMYNQLKYIIN